MPKAYVIGLGRSGIAAARLLKQEGWSVTLSDRSTSETLQNIEKILKKEDITVKLNHNLILAPASLPHLIVISPGVPWDSPVLVEARSLGIDIIGEIELAWRYLNSSSWIGVTGTNGKTTTTALIAAIFQASGLNAPACGNIGYAACELALRGNRESQESGVRSQKLGNRENKGEFTHYPLPITHYQNQFDWIVAEISSYQIESSRELAPKIGVWTTFTPDHLNRHKTLENYYEIKASLLRRCSYQIFNGDDPYLSQIGLNHWQDAYWTSLQGKNELLCEPARGVYVEDNWVVAFGELILPINLFKMVGAHNQQNLLMAVAVARLAGIPKNAIAQAIATFPGVPHRLEYICTIAGTDFINDSKATNYDAAEVGLASVPGPVILIAGGEAKEGDDTGWIRMIKAKAASVLLIGGSASMFAQRFRQAGYEAYEIVETMENALKRGVELAQQQQAKVVLLSPACASFDQYQSFEHRGEHFRELCLQS